ncbi:MAG: ABC transporter permease [bacterium]
MNTEPRTGGPCFRRWGIRLIEALRDAADWFAANPITLREFIRQARGFRFWILLAAVLSGGSAVLCLVWASYSQVFLTLEPFPIGRILYFAIISMEFLIIVVFLPGIVAHGLISERDQNTFPLLLTTPLSAGRILGGKLISTLGVMVLLIVATFPLISICLARGGVSPLEVALGSAGLVLACFLVASFAIFHALQAQSIFGAILLTQLTSFLFFAVGGSILAFWVGILYALLALLIQIYNMYAPASLNPPLPELWSWTMAGIGLLFFAGVPVFVLRASRSRLRYAEPAPRQFWEMRRARHFQFGQTVQNPHGTRAARSWWEYADGQNPIRVRERLGYAASQMLFHLASWYLVILLAHVFFLMSPLQEGRWVAIFTLIFIAQLVPAYAGPLFAREKERETWELLMTTITHTRMLLHGKLAGALSQCFFRAGILFGVPFLLSSLLFGFVQFWGLTDGTPFYLAHILGYALILLLHLFFLMQAGVYGSIHFAKVSQATTGGYLLACGVLALPYMLAFIMSQIDPACDATMIKMFSPLYLLYHFPTPETPWDHIHDWLFHAGRHFLFYLSGTLLLYGLSLRELNRIR